MKGRTSILRSSWLRDRPLDARLRPPLLGVLLLASILVVPGAPALALRGGPSPALPGPAEASRAASSSQTSSPSNSDPFGLAVGDQVDVVASALNVRQAPSSSAVVLAVEVEFRQGVIVAGSALADGYHWWEVSWDDNHTGWSAEGTNGTAWLQNLTGRTVTFNRAAAVAYAAQYWDVVTSDGYFWDGPDSYEQFAQGTNVENLTGDDCAHFVSQVIGDEPHQAGGGLDIPSRVPPTYGEPSAPDLGNMILDNGWGIQVNGTDQLEPGDVINYEWNPPDGTWDHIAVYLGNGEVAAHTDSNYGVNWTLGGAYAYRFIHILATSTGGSGVDQPLVALSLSPTSGPAPLTVHANATATGGSLSYVSYDFSWGDGTTSTLSTPDATHVYPTAGSYPVSVHVVDSLGAVGWAANQTVGTTTPPLTVGLSASPLAGTAPLAVDLTASPTGGSGAYASYLWTFGDGTTTTTTVPTASHTFASQGSYEASVSVTDSTGATASSSELEVQVSAPSAPLTVSLSSSVVTGTAPLTVDFSATASGGSGSYAYAWTFGDGSNASTAAPTTSHTYTSTGTFEASVEVSDGRSEATSGEVAIAVAEPGGSSPGQIVLTLTAAPPGGSPPFSTTFTLAVQGGIGPYTITWSFGDGSAPATSSFAGNSGSMSHTFAAAGTYSVTATLVDAIGRTVTASDSVVVALASPASSPSSSPLSFLGAEALVGLVAVGAVAILAGVLLVRRQEKRRRALTTEAQSPVPPGEGYGGWPPP